MDVYINKYGIFFCKYYGNNFHEITFQIDIFI